MEFHLSSRFSILPLQSEYYSDLHVYRLRLGGSRRPPPARRLLGVDRQYGLIQRGARECLLGTMTFSYPSLTGGLGGVIPQLGGLVLLPIHAAFDWSVHHTIGHTRRYLGIPLC